MLPWLLQCHQPNREPSDQDHADDSVANCTGPKVEELYFTMSGWQGVTLDSIMQPYVSLNDPATGMPLCEYHLEDQDRALLARRTRCVAAALLAPGSMFR